ncbi:MAG TPA: C4-type zinc ribbon domain-containing protein [bacterium]|nr:C4-type zinc ribbon domain-containing protein [bacterium]
MIKEDIEKLIELQEIDSLINDIEEEINSFPERKNMLEKELKDALEKNDAVKKEHKKLQIDRKENELELEGMEGEIKKLQIRLNEVKTNKEYTSILSEIETVKAKKSKTEDTILSIMEKDEVLNRTLSTLSEKNSRLTGEIELKVQAETKKTEENKLKLKELQDKRNAKLPSISKEIYAKYERILKGKKNRLAICRLENGSCSGCRVFVPTYIEEKVKEKKEIVNCENCSRILY